ncbi:MAG TPA: glycoside hydrolase family 3 N-terminal domain-containing protein [Caulobacterales bacterium]|nr:glycoside hydrolase family 3 N-terminal domain-containing protein [Caulobacterales bacterium]
MATGAAALGTLAAGEVAAQPRRRRSNPASSAAGGAPIYKDPHAAIEARVADLLGRMTLDEKIAQITTVWRQKPQIFDDAFNFDPAKFASVYPVGIGHMARPTDRQGYNNPNVPNSRTPRETVELVNAVQRYHVEHTRLGVPVLFHEEALHGHAARDATSFPQAIALASTWDPALHERIFTVVAREVRARGVQLVLAPVVDICRDPRWGRIEETYGEDPYLCGEMGVACVKGFQGETLPLAPDRVFATLKHMTGHGQPESGTNVGPAPYSVRYLRENFFPPFEQVVKRTNIRSVMASYNEIDGVPSHANHWLLHDVLRGEFGFKGAVISDYFAIEDLARLHHIEPDYASAAIRALRAGVDCDEPNGDCFLTLADSVRAGRVREEEIDVAVRRMLEIKFLSGMFEQPYADADHAELITDNDEARALAAEAARKAVVLLKNDNALPLSADRLRTLAVIGPSAAITRIGGYSNVPRRKISILEGVRAKVGSRVNVVTAEGVRLTEGDPEGDWGRDTNVLTDPAVNRRLIAEAVRVSRRADQIVLCFGGSSSESREGWSDNHLGDRDSLALLGQQEGLFAALAELGKPIIVVLINGRPQSLSPFILERANAIVEGWYLGQETGTAMADILFGDANPGGKLPVTIARNVGQLPDFYDHKPSARRGYLFESAAPLFPFGFGLSYTTFEIDAPRLSRTQIGVGESVEVSVSVRNTGARAGDEVVQLYIHDLVSSVTRPVLELKGFERVTLQAGETKTVRFALTPEHLRFWNIDMQRVVEPGEFDVMAGPNSIDLKSTRLTVV